MTKMTAEQLAQLLATTEKWLNEVDPETLVWENPVDLRRIGKALREQNLAWAELDSAIAGARACGRSWTEIGVVLGISRQGAQQRFGR